MLVDKRTGRSRGFVGLRGGHRNGGARVGLPDAPSAAAFNARWILPGLAVIFGAAVLKDTWPPAAIRTTTGSAHQLVTVGVGNVAVRVSITGSVVPVLPRNVDFQIGGQLREIKVAAGEDVRHGQVLARLDARSQRLGLDQALAALRVAQANLRSALVPATTAQVEELREELAIAQRDYLQTAASVAANNSRDAASTAAAGQLLDRDQQLLASMQAALTASTSYQVDEQRLSADQATRAKDQQTYLADGCASVPQPTPCSADAAALANDEAAVSLDEQQVAQDEAPVRAQQAKIATDHVTLAEDQSRQQNDQLAGTQLVANALAAVTRARDQLLRTQPNPNRIILARASLSAARAQVAAARLSLDRTTLTAPMDGTVLSVSGTVGERVVPTSGAKPFLVLYNPSALQFTASIPQDTAARLQPSQDAWISFDDAAGLTIHGHLLTVTASDVPGRVGGASVTLILDQIDPSVKAGMAAIARVDVAQANGVLVVPNGAISTNGDAANVIVLRDGKEIVTPVQLGLADDQQTEVTSGLIAGEQVLLHG